MKFKKKSYAQNVKLYLSHFKRNITNFLRKTRQKRNVLEIPKQIISIATHIGNKKGTFRN